MCGIFALLMMASKQEGRPLFDIDTDMLDHFIYGKYVGMADKPQVYVSTEDLDSSSIVAGMTQRGPDSIRGLIFESIMNEDGCLVSVNCQVIDHVDVSAIRSTIESMSAAIEGATVIRLLLVGSVLSLRRSTDGVVCRQPVSCESTVVMLNGEIFDVDYSSLNSMTDDICMQAKDHLKTFTSDTVDTAFVFELARIVAPDKDTPRSLTQLRLGNVLKCLIGEFSIVIYYPLVCQLFVVKDCIGKRSLLVGRLESGIVFSSILPLKIEASKVEPFATLKPKIDELEDKYMGCYRSAVDSKLIEVPSNQLFTMNFIKKREFDSITLNPAFRTALITKTEPVKNTEKLLDMDSHDSMDIKSAKALVSNLFEKSIKRITNNIYRLGKETIVEDSHNHSLDEKNESMDEKPISKHVIFTKAKVCLLFSGGLDSALIAFYLAKVLPVSEE